MTYMQISDLLLEGKRFIPTRKAVELFGYSADYIGQLCRGGKEKISRADFSFTFLSGA